MILPILIIAPSDSRGRGVFTTENISAKTIIEISPVLVLSEKDRNQVEKTILYDYIFEWGEDQKQACIAFGYLSMYNHSYKANCEYEMDFQESLMRIITLSAIKKGEELFINYNASINHDSPLWFTTN